MTSEATVGNGTTSGSGAADTGGVAEARQRICVIVNPASGVNRAALKVIEDFLSGQTAYDYEISKTKESGDAFRFAQEAVDEDFDLVAVYGGDGTLMEVADGLRDSGISMLILPGGTANIMAVELGIARDLESALALLTNPQRQTRVIDMGCIDDQYFLLRAGMGYEAEVSASAARDEKSRSGRLAYFRNSLRKLRTLRPTKYVITVDGVTHVQRGITCMICNSSSIGLPNLHLAADVSVSDGLLDVIVIRNMRPASLLRLLLSVLDAFLPLKISPNLLVDHWQGREITVESRRTQFVARDGEPMKRAKRISARVVPNVLHIVVPATTTEMQRARSLDSTQASG